MSEVNTKSREYIQHLPAVFKKESEEGKDSFLSQYLRIFEALLSGRKDADIDSKHISGLEEQIARLVTYLDPELTPVDAPEATTLGSEFLTYLARWVALIFDQNWGLDKKRQWLRRIVPLYKKRGTKSGLTEYLNMFVGNQVTVEELSGGFIIGEPDNSIIGENTFIAGAPAYYFRVKFNYGYTPEDFNIDVWKNLRKGSSTIVDQEKPAHTYYKLNARTPGIIVGGPTRPQNLARSTVGVDTLIWKESKQI